MRLRSSFYLPPGGRWFFTVPETKRYFESAMSMVDLERQVVAHLEQTGYPVPADLAIRIEEAMCRSLPKGSCLGDGLTGARRPGFFEVVEASQKFFRARKGFVDAREAERRAAVCRKCEMNDLGLCVSCTDLRKTTGMNVGGRKTHQDAFLGVCRNYAVPTFGMVWVEGVVPQADLPEGCWVKGGSNA